MKSVNELIMIEINRVKEYKDEYKNNPCIETAEKLYAAFYNLPDDWRNLKNGKNT